MTGVAAVRRQSISSARSVPKRMAHIWRKVVPFYKKVVLLTNFSRSGNDILPAFLEATEATEATGSDMVTTVNYHRYAKQSSAELIAEGAIS